MAVVDLLTPVVAVLALFAAAALAILFIRQGRALRRLESRVEAGGGAASRASLERIAQLQARMGIDSPIAAPAAGGRSRGGSPRRRVLGGLALLSVAGLAAGGWWLFLRDESPESPTASRTGQQTQTTATRSRVPLDGAIPSNLPALADKGSVIVAVLNASGVKNAAATFSERVGAAGYTPGKVDNAPPPAERPQSVVMFAEGSGLAARNVAKDLGLRCCALPLDGITPDDVDGAQVVVVVGLDLASNIGATTTP